MQNALDAKNRNSQGLVPRDFARKWGRCASERPRRRSPVRLVLALATALATSRRAPAPTLARQAGVRARNRARNEMARATAARAPHARSSPCDSPGHPPARRFGCTLLLLRRSLGEGCCTKKLRQSEGMLPVLSHLHFEQSRSIPSRPFGYDQV